MGELDKAIARLQAAPKPLTPAESARMERSARLKQEFADLMRVHNVGKTALYTLNYEPIVRRTGIFRPQETTVGSRPAFEKAGEGWVITEADRYSDSTFSWIALDEEPPRLFQCTGPILSETQHTENRQHPPYPYAYIHGALRHEVFVYTDQDAEILARAALRLTAQGQ